MSAFLLGLAHLARSELFLELLEFIGGFFEVTLGEVLGELVGRPLAAHFLELLELAIHLLGRAELFLPLFERIGERIQLDHQLVFAGGRGLGQLFGLLFNLGQDLLGLGELFLVNRLALTGDFLGEQVGLLDQRFLVDLGGGLRLGDAGNQAGAKSRQPRNRRGDQHHPGAPRDTQAEFSGDVEIGDLADGVGNQGLAGRRATQVRGQRQGRAHPLVQVKDAVERNRRVEPARARRQRDSGGNHQTQARRHGKWYPVRTGQATD